MKKLLNKVFAILIVLILLGIEMLPTCVYAANVVNEVFESTGSEVVAFDANINNERSIEANINDEVGINVDIRLLGEGYLKKVKLKFENNNYEISKTEEEINKMMLPDEEVTNVNKIVNSIDDSEIALREIEKDEDLKLVIPVKFKNSDKITKEDIERDSTIKLEATFVNGKDEDLVIEKNIRLHVKWNAEIVNDVNQKLLRYLKYDDKTMISFEITNAIKDNAMPVLSREILIEEPKLNNKLPKVTTVAGKDIDKEETDGILKVSQITEPEEGKYKWDSTEKYIVTYLYDEQVESTQIEQLVSTKATLISGEIVEGKTEENEFEVEDTIGNIIEVEPIVPKEINKGYIYTNLNRQENKLSTEYEVQYNINIGYADITDRILVEEKQSEMLNADGDEILDATEKIKTNKIEVSDDIEEILGQEGKITVKNENEEEIGTIDSTKKEINVEANNVKFEISNPEKEGNIVINISKEIEGENDFEIEQMTEFKTLKSEINVKGYSEEIELTNENKTSETTLTEPQSTASIELNTEALSTITGNKDTEFNVTLNKTDISDMLYTNPTIKITLPEEIRKISLKSAKILYDDELLIEKVEQEGRDIICQLSGVQTEYNTLGTTKGTLLKIVADVELDILAPSNEEKVVMEYTNDFTRETKTAEKTINIIAPNQVITTNQIEIDDQSAFATDKDVDILKIKTTQPEKKMQVTGQIINNLGMDVEGVQIIGRIPSAGNKTIGGAVLGSNINSTLASSIELSGFEGAQVLYSNNIEEDINGEGWQEEATADSKSYKIVLPESMNNKTAGGFRYTVTIPAYLDYEQTAKENYGVYYNNNSEQGTTQNLVESKVLGITTGAAPDLKVDITAIDTNEGFKIDNGGDVREGEFVTYKVKISNTGSIDANNVKVNTILSEALAFVETQDIEGEFGQGYVINEEEKNNEQVIDTIKSGDSITLSFDTVINQQLSTLESEENANIQIGFSVESDILDERIDKIYTVKNTEGTLNVKLATDFNNKEINKDTYKYLLLIYNANYKDKENVIAKIKLPNGVKLEKIRSEQESNYNEKTNELTVNVGTIGGGTTGLVSLDVINNYTDEELKAYAELYFDGMDKEVKSNEVVLKNLVSNETVKATQTSNITGEILDTDTLEFYIDLKNISDEPVTINIEDMVPEELNINEYKLSIDGQEIKSDILSYINEEITIPEGQSANLTISTKPFELEVGQEADTVNKPEITIKNGTKVNVEEARARIKGTRPAEELVEMAVEEGSEEEAEVVEEVVQKYRIAGSVWVDENRNGQKDGEELKQKGVKLVLYSGKTKEIAKDSNNKEIEAITDENGQYVFSDIEAGEYVIVSQYDSNVYQITNYKEETALESADSDFVAVRLENKDYAATDIIRINDDNIYNIDLGFVKVEQLNLSVSQSISKLSVVSDNNIRNIGANETSSKLELSNKELEDSTLLVEYNINVTNYGDIPGYAKQVIEYVPDGMKFNSEINPDWYMGKNGYLYSVSLGNDLINKGESRNIKLVLSKSLGKNELGIIRGKAEVKTSYSETDLAEIRAQSAKFINSESNVATSNLSIVKKVKIKTKYIIGISLGIMTLLVLTTYEVKKNIINKLYNLDIEE